MKSIGSKSEHSPAMWDGKGEGSNSVISPMPLLPCSAASQKFSTPDAQGRHRPGAGD